MPSHNAVMLSPQNLPKLGNCSYREHSYCHNHSHSRIKSQINRFSPTPTFCGTAPMVFMTDFKFSAKNSI